MPIIKSIHWEQDNPEELVYKFPFNNIALGSILTINESQEAFLFKNGTRLSLKPWGIALKFLFLHHENILFPND